MDAIEGHVEGGDEAALGDRAHLEWDAGEQCPVGRDPRTMSVADLEALGHRKEPLLRLIRRNCIECAGGSEAEVRRCAMIACPFWPYRMNTNPFAAEQSEERRAAAGERLRQLRSKAACSSDLPNPATCQKATEASAGSEIAPGTLPPGIAEADQG